MPIVGSVEQQDLGALFAELTRRIIEAERPILAAHGLTMWSYIALSRLADGPAYSQLALAQAMRHDKSRLIALLDELEADGLLSRKPDQADRRSRVVSLTAKGRTRMRATRRDIHSMESDLLAHLSKSEQLALRETLARLAAD
jgi:DNA-binding MarR family transcriptional regulator